MGQRGAYDRIAHLIAELYVRLQTVDVVRGASFDLPLTQEKLGDTMGLTAVHVNRVLQRMRAEGLIVLNRSGLHIPDINRLMQVTEYDPKYLHLDRRDGQARSRRVACRHD